ncbi:glycosyltransferase [Geobacter sp.]|uniref:glycosyltransferase n=1 Tax=Geobacter sp. TaxID=46610 RepID=UPI00261A5054|nr:glycosyltransferase [Geobacter sp.]
MTQDTDVQNGISRILPHTVHFLLNDKCNAKCVFCGGDYYRSKSGKVITLDKFARMAENLHLEHFRNICLAGAGDPLLDPDFMPIVRYTNERYPNIDITVTTNGIALKPELSAEMMGAKVSLVNISINAATRATYKRLMQVDQFDTVCANAAAFVRERDRAGRQTLFQLSCAISRLNIEELPTLVELAHRLGVRHLNIFYCRFYPKSIRHLNIEATDYLLEDRESLFFHQELSDRKVMEAKALAERYGIFMAHEPLFREKGAPKKCVWTETELLVGFDGEVYPCGGGEVHFKKKVESGVYRFGNALTQRIEEFWNNDTYRSLRISCRRGTESPIVECRFCANLMQHDDIRSHLMEWEGFEEERPAPKSGTSLPLVSVIVPTYNRPDMLPDTLRSILAQSYPHIEIVVVNDAGEDVERLVKEVAPGAVYLRHERNKGLAGARNTGIRHAAGKYIAYLDDDDLFYPGHVETLVTFLEGSDFRVAYTDSYRAFQSQASGRYEVVRREVAHGVDFDYDRILVDNFVPVLCFMHEKRCIEESGYFDESLRRHEDWDLWIRMSRRFRFAHIPRVTCEFSCRVDGSGMTTGTVPMFLVTRNAIYAKYRHLASPDVQRRQRADTWEFMRHLYTFLEGRVEPLVPLFVAGCRAEGEARLAELATTGATEAQRESALADQLALACLKNGAVADAVTQLERAVAADGMNPIASHNLAAVYRKSGRSADAARIYLGIVAQNESEVPALIALAELSAERNDVPEACRRYEQVLAVEPDHCAAAGALAALPHAEAASGNRLRVAVYSLDHPEHACARIRVIAPAETLADAVELGWGVDLGSDQAGVNTALIAWADLIIVQRFFPMANTAPLLERILAAGKPVIYETDDLLVEVPATNPHQRGADAARPFIFDLIAKAAAVTVSTEEMKRAFAPHHRRIHVLPNLLDDRLWSAPLPVKAAGAPVVIGYAGTPDHRADLALLEEVLERIAAKYGSRVAFRFMGCDTERIKGLPGFSAISFEPGYGNYARAIQQAGIDIGLVPLADNRFNRCKSNIKWLEYSACGIAGIYADLPPYRSCVREGETGLLVAGYDADAWVAALESLIDNPDRRHAMAVAARTEVLANYTLKSRGRLFLDTWHRVVGRTETIVKEQEMSISPQPFAPCAAPTDASTPRVSVIIPLYNKVEYTRQCLEALALNTDQALNYEVILVDNASSDGTADYLRTLSGEVTIVTNLRNLGFARGCNQGGRIARGRYLVFLNNDTIPHPGWLDALIRGAEEDGADIVGAKLLYPNGRVQHAGVAFNEQSIGYHIFNGFPATAPAVNRKRLVQCVTAACLLVKRELFAELGGFDEGYVNGFEDVDFCLRAGERGRRILYTPESVLIHFEETSEGRKSHDEPNVRRFLARWEGKVRRDDADLYRTEGFGTERMADGRLRIFPLQSAPEPSNTAAPASTVAVSSRPSCSAPSPEREAALALKEEGRFAEALEMLSKILARGDRSLLVEAGDCLAADGDRSVLADMGDCLANLGRLDEAAASYQEALREDEGDLKALVGLGVVSLMQGKQVKAVTWFNRAIKADPANARALCGLGMVRNMQGKAGEAYDCFARALDADPENLTALHELVKLAYATERFEEALPRLAGYLMYHPADLDMLYTLAGVQFKAGRNSEALESIGKVLLFAPEYEGGRELSERIQESMAA